MKLIPITDLVEAELSHKPLNEKDPAIQTSLDPFCAMRDEELAVLAKTHELALTSLYRRYVDRIARYVSRQIPSRQDAEDVTAQVFLLMVRGLPKWTPSDVPFIAWLFRLATNAIISWSRRQRFRKWIGLSYEPVARLGPPQDDVEELTIALQQVPEPYQRTLVLHYIEQLSVFNVAQVLGVAEGTVKSRLARGRTILKQILETRQE